MTIGLNAVAVAAAAKSLQSAPLSLGFSRQEHWSGLPFPSLMQESENWKWSCSVVSDPQRSHGLQPSRLLHPWDLPGKITGVGCHCLLRYKRHSDPNIFMDCFLFKFIIKYWLYSLWCTIYPCSLFILYRVCTSSFPNSKFPLASSLPLVVEQLVLYICESVPVKFLCLFHFFRFHV